MLKNIPGADAPQSRTLQNLDRFTPEGVTALATVGLALLDAANQGQIVENDDLLLPMFEAMRNVLCRTYPLQDALHGASDGLPAALAGFLAMVEEARRVKAVEVPDEVQQAGQRDQEPARCAASASMRADTSAQTDSQPKPYFSAVGNPAQFFTVSDGITAETALEGASMFLTSAVGLGNNPEALDDGGRWAAVHLGEMAKALVDTVVNAQMERRRLKQRASRPCTDPGADRVGLWSVEGHNHGFPGAAS